MELTFGDGVIGFLFKLCNAEKIDKKIRKRAEYIYIYFTGEGLVKEICFVDKKQRRKWVKVEHKYLMVVDIKNLDPKKTYMLQFNKSLKSCPVFICP